MMTFVVCTFFCLVFPPLIFGVIGFAIGGIFLGIIGLIIGLVVLS